MIALIRLMIKLLLLLLLTRTDWHTYTQYAGARYTWPRLQGYSQRTYRLRRQRAARWTPLKHNLHQSGYLQCDICRMSSAFGCCETIRSWSVLPSRSCTRSEPWRRHSDAGRASVLSAAEQPPQTLPHDVRLQQFQLSFQLSLDCELATQPVLLWQRIMLALVRLILDDIHLQALTLASPGMRPLGHMPPPLPTV